MIVHSYFYFFSFSLQLQYLLIQMLLLLYFNQMVKEQIIYVLEITLFPWMGITRLNHYINQKQLQLQ